jgi:hypothetical protein
MGATTCAEKVRVMATEAITKADQQAKRKYAMAAAKIIEASEEQLGADRNRQAANGSLLSSGTWRLVAKNFAERLEALLHARLNALLDAYELYGVPLDDEIEAQVIQDLSSLRESETQSLNQFASVQPWLVPTGTVYIRGELSRVSDFLNEAKSAMEERRHKPRSSPRDPATPTKARSPLVFVSCGQSTSAERELGKAVAKLVEEEAGCTAYFAENQTTLEGVTENILKRLNDAVAFLAIMHPRGDVTNPKDRDEPARVRGSVWVEQEIAIAAFISQALGRPMQVRSYVHQSIRLEGLRDKLHLNPVRFHKDSEILDDLTSFLPSWRALVQQHRKEPLSLKANIKHQRVAIPGGGGDDERYMLLVNVENDGEQDATDFRLDVDFPSALVDGSGYVIQVPSTKPGFARFQIASNARGIEHLYPGDQTGDLITFHYVITGKVKRENPEQLEERVTATVYSGNMRPRRTVKTIAELTN